MQAWLGKSARELAEDLEHSQMLMNGVLTELAALKALLISGQSPATVPGPNARISYSSSKSGGGCNIGHHETEFLRGEGMGLILDGNSKHVAHA